MSGVLVRVHLPCVLRSSAKDVFSEPVLDKDISNAKPAVALARIRDVVADIGREAWAKRARTTAVLGNCPKTLACMRSGVSHWCSYISITRGSEAEPFPVDMHDILGWSLAFRCIGTFSNYLGHVRSTSCALGHEPPPVGHPSVRRAMGAIAKRMWHSPRPKLAIQRTLLRNMMDRDNDQAHWALWLVSYLWLLRVPSEALPLTVCDGEPPCGILQAAIWRDSDQICIKLKSRKNLQGGSGIIRRCCTCPRAPMLCPVHRLWEGYLVDVPLGTRPWKGTSASMALRWIRDALRLLSVSLLTVTCVCSPLSFVWFRYRMLLRMAPTPSEGGMPGTSWRMDPPWRRSLGLGSGEAPPSSSTLILLILKRGQQWRSLATQMMRNTLIDCWLQAPMSAS